MPRYLSEDGLPTSKTRSASYLMRRFACPLRCRMRDGGSNCRSEPSVLRLSHGLSTMRGGGRGAGGAIREDAATYSRLASSFRSRRRRSAARTTRPATFIGTSLTDYLRRFGVRYERRITKVKRRSTQRATEDRLKPWPRQLDRKLDSYSTATRQLLDSYSKLLDRIARQTFDRLDS